MMIYVVICDQAYACSFSVHGTFSSSALAQHYIDHCALRSDLRIEVFVLDQLSSGKKS